MTNFIAEVVDEIERARRKHPKPFNSQHEGLAIIREEYLDFEDEVFHGDAGNYRRRREELIQLAAMCQRFAEDCL